MSYELISHCRACKNSNLVDVLNLGDMALTGIFPASKEAKVDVCPIVLVKCHGGADACGLVQLKHNFDLDAMYGVNYGYRSGLNPSMVKHLHNTVKEILERVSLQKGDLVVDIGSNDSTLLQAYPNDGVSLVGIDPTGIKFQKYYPDHIQLVPEFFPSATFKAKNGSRKAKIITSLSMFYDLPDPVGFASNIADLLADDGIWVFEQSYLPTMLEMNSYDTICHEHLEYYSLKSVMFILEKAGLKALDVSFNFVNGGSFVVTASKKSSNRIANEAVLRQTLERESQLGLDTLKPYQEFASRINQHRDDLTTFLKRAKADGKLVIGYGASTKGNVLLQYCGITEQDIPFVAEVNSDKFGSFTPGSRIQIISETQAKTLKPDFMMVLPWHFRNFIVEKERAFLENGGKLYFPLPVGEIV